MSDTYMTPSCQKYLLLLRLLLISAGVAWGVSVAGLVLPWAMVEKELRGLGAGTVDDVMVQYWLKMAAAVYTALGCFYVWVAIRPVRYRAVIGLIGWLHVILGAVFLVNGQMLGVGAIPLYVDVGFCFCVGLGIVAVNGRLRDCFDSEARRRV
ncbi:MAG: hypothetical protein IH624_05890 [Phycisphaerae bacterium]|nr:hypothetical protein [Phycisphaerae bacterium]